MLAYADPQLYTEQPTLGNVDPRGTCELAARIIEDMVADALRGDMGAIMAFEGWKDDPEGVCVLRIASEMAGISEADCLDAILKRANISWDINPDLLQQARVWEEIEAA